MNLERLSSNVIYAIDEILKNQTLVNYIGFTGDNPSNEKVDPSTIAPRGKNERIFPLPFDTTFKTDVRTQLHIYYPNITFENNGNVGKTIILFDIVVHKDIWLLMDKGEKLIRPYKIANLILETFKGEIIQGLGEIHFLEGDHVVVNEKFEGFRLVATTTEF